MAVEAKQRIAEYVAGRTRLAEQKIAQAEAQALLEVRALSADVAIAAAEKLLTVRAKGEGARRSSTRPSARPFQAELSAAASDRTLAEIQHELLLAHRRGSSAGGAGRADCLSAAKWAGVE